MTDDDLTDEKEVEEVAGEVARESAEMGDYGPIEDVEGECEVCGSDATWQSPEGQYYCQEHASEHFRKRHG